MNPRFANRCVRLRRVVLAATTAGLVLVTAASSWASPLTVVAHYRLGDDDPGAAAGNPANATTVDSVGGQDLTRSGDPVYVSSASYDPTGLAVSFSGDDDYSAAALFMPTDNFAMDAWVRPASTDPGNRAIAYLGQTDVSGFGLFQYSDSVGFLYGGNVAAAIAPATKDAWMHLVLARDSGETKFWVGTTLLFSSFDGPNPIFGQMVIGANHVGTENFIGDISDVRLFTFAPGTFDVRDTVPEPATVSLLGLGLAGLGVRLRPRR